MKTLIALLLTAICALKIPAPIIAFILICLATSFASAKVIPDIAMTYASMEYLKSFRDLRTQIKGCGNEKSLRIQKMK